MHKRSAGLLSLLFVAGLAGPALAAPHVAKVSLEAARKTALARVPGKVKHEELEEEHHVWIYSFEIVPEGQDPKVKTIREVNVDADTGAIVSVETEKD